MTRAFYSCPLFSLSSRVLHGVLRTFLHACKTLSISIPLCTPLSDTLRVKREKGVGGGRAVVVKDVGTSRTFYLPISLLYLLDEAAKKHGVNASWIVRRALEHYLEHLERGEVQLVEKKVVSGG